MNPICFPAPVYRPKCRGQSFGKLGLAACLVLWLANSVDQSWAAERPNFLIILADDLGYSDLGCYGGEIATPHLDRLARQGLQFTQFYNTARCWPTRGAILTGYYPQQVRMDPPQGKFAAWTRTLPQLLKPQGYRSYHSGKWHVHGAPNPVADAGFDRSYYLGDHDRHFYPRDHREDDRPLPAVEPGSGYYTTTAIADHAIRCLKEHAEKHAAAPFFQYVAFTVPHFPVQAPPEDLARYKDKYAAGWDDLRTARYRRQRELRLVDCALSAPEPKILAPSGRPDTAAKLGPGEVFHAVGWAELTAEQKTFQAAKMAAHAAMVDRLDREVGRILDQLKTQNALDNTVIFFLSDNGASAEILVRGDGHDAAAAPGSAASYLCLGPGGSTLSNTPFRRHKIWVHEGGISTPLIVHWPRGIAARGELRHGVGHVIDFVPTLLELAGTKLENNRADPKAPPLAGRSLVPAFAKDDALARDFLFFHHSGHRALRMDDWKLVSAKDNQDEWELYNLARDRGESSNLAASEPDRVRRMSSRWVELERQFRAEAAK